MSKKPAMLSSSAVRCRAAPRTVPSCRSGSVRNSVRVVDECRMNVGRMLNPRISILRMSVRFTIAVTDQDIGQHQRRVPTDPLRGLHQFLQQPARARHRYTCTRGVHARPEVRAARRRQVPSTATLSPSCVTCLSHQHRIAECLERLEQFEQRGGKRRHDSVTAGVLRNPAALLAEERAHPRQQPVQRQQTLPC